VEFLFLLAKRPPYQNASQTMKMKRKAPSVTPTPIPAFAPVERPWWGCEVGVGDCVPLNVVEELEREVVENEIVELVADEVVVGEEVEGDDVVTGDEVEDSGVVFVVADVVAGVLLEDYMKSEQEAWGGGRKAYRR
jgi:hypothetical protein